MESISEKLIKLRKEKGLSQEQLAKDLFVSRQAVSKWETNRSLPNIEMIKQICNYYNIDVNQLITNEDISEITLKNNEEVIKISNKTKINRIILICTSILTLTCLILFLVFNIFNKDIIDSKDNDVIGVLFNTELFEEDNLEYSLEELYNLNLPFHLVNTVNENDIEYLENHGNILSFNSLSVGSVNAMNATLYINKNNAPRLLVQYLIYQEEDNFILSKGISSLLNSISTLTIPVNLSTYSSLVVVERVEETKNIEIIEYDSNLDLVKSEFITKESENYKIDDSKSVHIHTETISDLISTVIYTKENLEEDIYINWYEALSNGLVNSNRIYLN
ncbi:MAG: helix-turn-helix transcriptional regulator [bacterium]